MKICQEPESIDMACIGGGPANLSLAALGEFASEDNFSVFERKSDIDWYPQAFFDDSQLQTSFLEDLVTTVAPTHPLSFLSYLSNKGRLFQFLCFNSQQVSRLEYQQYLQWAAGQLRSLNLDSEVLDITLEEDHFLVHLASKAVRARAISIGVGVQPNIPEWAKGKPRSTVCHVWDILQENPDLTGKRVVVVGGGQSSAEVAITLLNSRFGEYSKLSWICRRPNLIPIDGSPFVNEFYSPHFVEYFSAIDSEARAKIDKDTWRYFDGVSPASAETLYSLLYNKLHVEGRQSSVEIVPGHEIVDISEGTTGITLSVRSLADGLITPLAADFVILAAGMHRPFPKFMASLRSRISMSGDEFELDQNYKVKWDGPSTAKIYAQNQGRKSHGVADNSFCLLAWRNAVILNDYLGREAINIRQSPSAINWSFGRNHKRYT